ncbi:MAG: hypothetical protein LBI18_14740 [Planctomycetaceae bacterium]|jgi:hypothetical protein|nr:hypothetical protein [Planctomycetaceae bacterium]
MICVKLFAVSPFENAFIINEDNSHFFIYRGADQMNVEGVNSFIDGYATGKVTHLFLCPNGMRANFKSKTRETIWDPYPLHPTPKAIEEYSNTPIDEKNQKQWWPWFSNAKRFHDQGLDPYKLMIDRCREKGISPWISMRMNDLHLVHDPNCFRISTFWKDNPQLRINPSPNAKGWKNLSFDFTHDEVREHQFAFFQELLERYDCDGIELDWMRAPYFFKEGEGKKNAHLLTDFMRKVRKMIDEQEQKRGHKVLLGVRVPFHPDGATNSGMNAVLWAQEGLVDLIVPAAYHEATDFDAPIPLWREQIGGDLGKNFPIIPCAEKVLCSHKTSSKANLDNQLLYGFCDNMKTRGADGIYLFNWFDAGTRRKPNHTYEVLMHDGIDQKTILRKPRRYPVTYRDVEPNNQQISPKELTDQSRIYQIPVGTKPKSGNVSVIVGFAEHPNMKKTSFAAKLNDHLLDLPIEFTKHNTLGSSVKHAIQFSANPDHIVAGTNKIELTQITGEPLRVLWVEITVRP